MAYKVCNHKEYLPQMTKWLERREKVLEYAAFLDWRVSGHRMAPDLPEEALSHIKMTKYPSVTVSLDQIDQEYGATDFGDALADFVTRHNFSGISRQEYTRRANETRILLQRKVPVFHTIKVRKRDVFQRQDVGDEQDTIHVRPAKSARNGSTAPARFDTALIEITSGPRGGSNLLRSA
jgi:hypothetical protein